MLGGSKDATSMCVDGPIMIILGTVAAISLSAAFHSVGRLLGYGDALTVDEVTPTFEKDVKVDILKHRMEIMMARHSPWVPVAPRSLKHASQTPSL
ncbi:hypothetical protein MMC14_003278 [Varicellaria rhodocarpa]|nr:hypothetical protein [Varicellaria rhodocarpa]